MTNMTSFVLNTPAAQCMLLRVFIVQIIILPIVLSLSSPSPFSRCGQLHMDKRAWASDQLAKEMSYRLQRKVRGGGRDR